LFLHPKDSRNHLLFLWLAGFALAVGFSESTPASQRYVAAAPAVALMIGFSMKELGDLFGRLFSNRTRIIQTILVVIVFLLAADDARSIISTILRTVILLGLMVWWHKSWRIGCRKNLPVLTSCSMAILTWAMTLSQACRTWHQRFIIIMSTMPGDLLIHLCLRIGKYFCFSTRPR